MLLLPPLPTGAAHKRLLWLQLVASTVVTYLTDSTHSTDVTSARPNESLQLSVQNLQLFLLQLLFILEKLL